MSLPTTLRVFVVLELGFMLMSGLTGVVLESSLPEPLRSYSEAQGADDLTGNALALVALGLPLFVVAFVASIGLLVSWRPARILYVATRVAVVAITPLFGPYVDDGWSEMFDTAGYMSAGMVLGLLYWSPLAATYNRGRETAAV